MINSLEKIMKIRLLVVGRIKERSIQELVNEYLKRLKPFCNIEIIELRDKGYQTQQMESPSFSVKLEYLSKACKYRISRTNLAVIDGIYKHLYPYSLSYLNKN